jgi:hypothetical protein
MNLFDPASLSPLSIAPVPCALPYDLTWDDLRPALPGFTAGGETAAQAFIAHEKQGLHGGENSCILTLRYPDAGGVIRSETIFVKHATNAAQFEAAKYRYLASKDFPTPRLLCVVRKGDAEIVLLEFLPVIGINFRDASEVESLLHLAAQLSALPQPQGLLVESPGMPQDEFDRHVHAALVKLAQDRTWGFEIDVPRWFSAYQVAQEAHAAMPKAVSHNQFHFQQVGWAHRGDNRELVMFDLQTLGLNSRFSDVSGVLRPLAVFSGRDEVELFTIYLERLRQLQRIELGLDEALHEFRLVRVSEECASLQWYLSQLKPDGEPGVISELPMKMNSLRDDMLALGLL